MPTMHLDYRGSLKSLGGVDGRPDNGLNVWNNKPDVGTSGVEILGSQINRVCALLTNEGGVDVLLYFDSAYATQPHTLRVGGSFQIDEHFPWTGGVYGKTAAGTGSVAVTQIAVIA